MTTYDCTASTVVSGTIPYPILVSDPARHRVAEEGGEYHATQPDTDPFTDIMKREALEPACKAIDGQVGRLYALANLLLKPEPMDRPAEQLAAYGLEVRHAASQIEDFMYKMVDPLIGKSDEGDDDLDDE